MDKRKSGSCVITRLTLYRLVASNFRWKHLKENRHCKFLLELFVFVIIQIRKLLIFYLFVVLMTLSVAQIL
jgi:hypothetical protein